MLRTLQSNHVGTISAAECAARGGEDRFRPLLDSTFGHSKSCPVLECATRVRIHEQLEMGGMAPFVQIVVTSVEHGRPKPHPTIFEVAISKLGTNPRDTLFIGDSYQADYLGAKGAGLRALHIASPGTNQAPQSETISSVLEVANLLEMPVA